MSKKYRLNELSEIVCGVEHWDCVIRKGTLEDILEWDLKKLEDQGQLRRGLVRKGETYFSSNGLVVCSQNMGAWAVCRLILDPSEEAESKD